MTGGQTISSKIDLCKGVIGFMDLGECLKLLRIPLILVHSRKNCFIHNRQCDDMSKAGVPPTWCDISIGYGFVGTVSSVVTDFQA